MREQRATTSESEVAGPPETPSSRASPASWAVLTRLPLCPSATPVPAAVVRKMGCEFSQVVDPVVEYRQWPTATCPTIAPSVCSSNTWLTRPRS